MLAIARHAWEIRERRSDHFAGELFGEPAWDMLLHLFIGHLEGDTISVRSCCVALGMSNTTALRYLVVFGEAGLVRRVDLDDDANKTFIAITSLGFEKMACVLRG